MNTNGYHNIQTASLSGLSSLHLDELHATGVHSENTYIQNVETSNLTIDESITVNTIEITPLEVSRLSGVSSNIQVQISGLDVRLDSAESDVVSLDVRLTTTEGDVTALDARLTTAETDLSNLETTVDLLDTSHDSHETRITTLESSNAYLEEITTYQSKSNGVTTFSSHVNCNDVEVLGDINLLGLTSVISFYDYTQQSTAFTNVLKSSYDSLVTLWSGVSRSLNEFTFPVNTILKADGGGAIDEIRVDHLNCYQKVEFPDTTEQTTAFTTTDRANLDVLTVSKKSCYWEEIDGPVTYWSSMDYNTTYQTSSGGHYMTSSELSTTPSGGDSNMIDSSGYIQYTGRYLLQVSFDIMGIASWTEILGRVLVKKNGTLERTGLFAPGVWDSNRGSVNRFGCVLSPLIFTVGDVADNWTFEIHTYVNMQTVGSGSKFWKTHIDLVQI